MDEIVKEFVEYIEFGLVEFFVFWKIEFGELMLIVNVVNIFDVVCYLCDNSFCKFINLIDICGVDYFVCEKCFEVVYYFLLLV